MSTSNGERELSAIWKRQPSAGVTVTPEQLRERAEQFQAQTRRKNVRDYVCAGVVVVAYASWIFLAHAMLVRLGAAMLMLWGLYFIYGLNRFGSASGLPLANGDDCTTFHREELKRQRDFALSRPWGMALAAPGFVLISIGMHLAGKHPENWEMPIAMIGLAMFFSILTVIDGQLIAAKLQREIDALGQ